MAIKTSIKLDSRTSAVSSSGAGMRGENPFIRDQYDKAQGQNGKG
jgi:hypothetical protein